jgi:hypothetical protein
MPNGGIPIQMALFPRKGELVLLCKAGTLQVFNRSSWTDKTTMPEPLCELSKAEAAALAWFLGHWLGEAALKPGYEMRGEVDADYL